MENFFDTVLPKFPEGKKEEIAVQTVVDTMDEWIEDCEKRDKQMSVIKNISLN